MCGETNGTKHSKARGGAMRTSLHAHGVAVDVAGALAEVVVAQIRRHTRGEQLREAIEVGERLVLELA